MKIFLTGFAVTLVCACCVSRSQALTIDSISQTGDVNASVNAFGPFLPDSDSDGFSDLVLPPNNFSPGASANNGGGNSTAVAIQVVPVYSVTANSLDLRVQNDITVAASHAAGADADGIATFSLEFSLSSAADYTFDGTVSGNSIVRLLASGGTPIEEQLGTGNSLTSGQLAAGSYEIFLESQATDSGASFSTDVEADLDFTLSTATPTGIPEPSTFVLGILSLLSLGMIGRRQRRR